MSLSKKQLVSVSAVAGFVIAAGSLGWFLFDSVTVRGEQEEELAQQTSAFQRLNDAPVFPSKKTIAESKTNQIALVSWLEAARAYAARGDRKIGKVIETAWRKGCNLDSWDEHFKFDVWMESFAECGVEPEFYANRTRSYDEVMPWDIFDYGVTKKFIINENKKAHQDITTPNCRQKCSGCGANCLKGGACFE